MPCDPLRSALVRRFVPQPGLGRWRGEDRAREDDQPGQRRSARQGVLVLAGNTRPAALRRKKLSSKCHKFSCFQSKKARLSESIVVAFELPRLGSPAVGRSWWPRAALGAPQLWPEPKPLRSPSEDELASSFLYCPVYCPSCPLSSRLSQLHQNPRPLESREPGPGLLPRMPAAVLPLVNRGDPADPIARGGFAREDPPLMRTLRSFPKVIYHERNTQSSTSCLIHVISLQHK